VHAVLTSIPDPTSISLVAFTVLVRNEFLPSEEG
jgi:hypothetical protein